MMAGKWVRINESWYEIRARGLTPSPVLQSDFAKAMVDGGVEQACDLRAGNPVFCVLTMHPGLISVGS